jgi:DNA primase small subunit
VEKILTEKEIFLKKIFKKYYYNNVTKITIPARLPEREIGYFTFSHDGMIRNLKVENVGELSALILHEAPKAFYYSSAYYDDPSAPINSRVWKGADLIFDIDLDHLPKVEGLMEILFFCNDCRTFFSSTKKNCTNCGSNKIEEIKIATKNGLEYCKQEIVKLSDVLIRDFGLSNNDLKIYFSGKRGYHLAVENSSYEKADQNFRLELSDYLTLNGFRLKRIIDERSSSEQQSYFFPTPWEKGWPGRFSKDFCEKLLRLQINAPDEDFFRKTISEYISKNSYKDLLNIFESIKQNLSIKIDVAVTTDIHRIFRMPDTLHGGTGLVKKKIVDINSFSPLVDSAVLSDEPTKVHVFYSPKFELKEQQFGPYNNQKVILPEMAAVFLVAMNLAEPLENDYNHLNK